MGHSGRVCLIQHWDRWRTLVNTVLNLRVPQNARNLFTGGWIVRRSGLTVLLWISYFSPSPGRMWEVKALSVQIIKYRARSRGTEVRFCKCNIIIYKVNVQWTWMQILNSTSVSSIHPVYVILPCNLCVIKDGPYVPQGAFADFDEDL
jgi:hypothetical protein